MSWLKDTPIAHRGFHQHPTIPENSMASFIEAMKRGYAIECDVRLSKDDEVVVFHDRDLSRMTKEVGTVDEWALSDLKKLRLLETEEAIPTLKEVLERVNGVVPLLIEIKTDGDIKHVASTVADVLDDYTGVFAIQSFHPGALTWFKIWRSHVTRGQLAEFFLEEDLAWWKKQSLKRFAFNLQTKPDFVNYALRDLPNRYVTKQKKQGRLTLAYTITNETELEEALTLVDNVVFEGFER